MADCIYFLPCLSFHVQMLLQVHVMVNDLNHRIAQAVKTTRDCVVVHQSQPEPSFSLNSESSQNIRLKRVPNHRFQFGVCTGFKVEECTGFEFEECTEFNIRSARVRSTELNSSA